jgi:hypothetical protein
MLRMKARPERKRCLPCYQAIARIGWQNEPSVRSGHPEDPMPLQLMQLRIVATAGGDDRKRQISRCMPTKSATRSAGSPLDPKYPTHQVSLAELIALTSAAPEIHCEHCRSSAAPLRTVCEEAVYHALNVALGPRRCERRRASGTQPKQDGVPPTVCCTGLGRVLRAAT